ncbi:major facilitator superfamily domain-containing protein 6 isoform X2 [Folsomia candida]|uniref:major facilitator superfamily domain-containing protein 6 isoform X2 n=1 Tax=Folsomia candida TaxID=158441 RepID=UPI000B8F5602|nr:major facilitator superfamily domain-containing protein 6 isoform X2 [Folsomia candida]
MQINIKYLPIKAHYFFYWGGVASIWSFIAVFGKQMGISEVGVGLIFTVAPVAGLIAKPVFGAVADRFKKKKMIFLFFLLLNLMAFLSVAFLPQNLPVHPVQLDCAMGMSSIRQCGRLNPHCAESVIKSFKKECVDERRRKERLNTTSAGTDSHIRSARSSLDSSDQCVESCRGYCEIHGIEDGIRFCHSLFPHNQPEICRIMSSPPQIQNNSMLIRARDTGEHYDKEDDDDEESEIDGSRTERSIPRPSGPHIIDFDVKLKIDEVLMIDDPWGGREESPAAPGKCLYIPIKEVSFYKDSDPLVFRGLSCHKQFLLQNCYIDCPNNTALNRQLESIQEEEELLDAMNFWMYGSLVVIAWIAMSVVESLADAMCFQTLADESGKYGRQRLWGTIGWGIFQLVAGYLIDTSSQGKLLKDYTPSFYITAGLLTIDLIVAYKWSVREVEKTKSLRRDLCSVLSNLRIVVFIVACVIIGMCTGLLWNFLFWYVELLSEKQQLQASCESHHRIKLLQGLIGAIQCLGELPFFFISGWVIQKLGHVHCITLVLGAFGIRFIIYSFLVNPWTILPVELLQGLTYGVFYSTMVSYAHKISPVGTSATVIGVIQAAFLGIGVASGSLVGGLIFHKYSGGTAFRVFGVGCLIFCAIHATIMCILNKKSNYGFPSDRTEPEGQEMFKISSSTQDVADSDEGP